MTQPASLARSDERLSSTILRFYDNPMAAMCTTAAVLIALTLIYFMIHLFRADQASPWQDAIFISDDGAFAVSYRDDVMSRFFSEGETRKLQERLRVKSTDARANALAERRQHLNGVILLSSTSLSHRAPPGLLGMHGAQPKDSDYLALSLGVAKDWLNAHRAEIEPGKQANLSDALASIERLLVREEATRERLKKEIEALAPPLSFHWLYHSRTGWLLEVVFWTWFGVLANTLIALILATRQERYSAEEFVLVLPKFILAPWLSVVVVALWASGFSDSEIAYLNLPWFLCLAFFLGFMTESLYAKLRDAAELIVGRASTVSVEKLKAAGRQETYRFTENRPEGAPPRTLRELADKLHPAARAEMERSLVTSLANKPAPAKS